MPVLTEQTRYRLIGTIFLVAVAAITLPMLFDGEGVEPMQLDPLPPATLEVERDDTPLPDMTPALDAQRELAAEIDEDGYAKDTGTRFGEPVLLEEPPAAQAEADATRANAPHGALEAPSPTPPAADAAETAPAEAPAAPALKWAVQVASFTQAENATALRDRLVGDGYTAFLSNVKRDGKVVTRVAVGPYITRDAAAREKDDVDQRYRVQAAVVRFSY